MPRLLEQRPPQLSLQLREAHRPPSRLELLTKELGHRREREWKKVSRKYGAVKHKHSTIHFMPTSLQVSSQFLLLAPRVYRRG